MASLGWESSYFPYDLSIYRSQNAGFIFQTVFIEDGCFSTATEVAGTCAFAATPGHGLHDGLHTEQWLREQVEGLDRAAGTCCLTFYLQRRNDGTHLRGATRGEPPQTRSPGRWQLRVKTAICPVLLSASQGSRQPRGPGWRCGLQHGKPQPRTSYLVSTAPGPPTRAGKQPGVEPGYSVDFYS